MATLPKPLLWSSHIALTFLLNHPFNCDGHSLLEPSTHFQHHLHGCQLIFVSSGSNGPESEGVPQVDEGTN